MDTPGPTVASGKSALAELLKRFNRKERYWLLADALGEKFSTLDPNYRQRLGKLLDLQIPDDAWWAIDYHFNWLYAALWCAKHDLEPPGDSPLAENNGSPPAIADNLEDIDLLIAFGQTLILVEAKGVTGWTNGQMTSKARRLSSLTDVIGDVDIRLVLTSPRYSTGLEKGDWIQIVPDKMMPPKEGRPYHHMTMKSLAGRQDLLRVERFKSAGMPAETGNHWRIVRSPVGQDNESS